MTAYLKDALANVFILPEGENGLELARVLPPGRPAGLEGRPPLQPPGRGLPRPAVGAARRAAAPARDRGPAGPHPGAGRASARTSSSACKSLESRAEARARTQARRVREELARARQEDHDLEVEYLKLSQSSQQSERRREAIRAELADIEKEEEAERLEMQEAQHALEQGSQKIEAIVQRLQALEARGEARRRRALDGARAAILAAERAQQEARFHERSCHDKVASQGAARRLAGRAPAGARRQPRPTSRAELGKLEEGSVRERLQGALAGEERAREGARRCARRASSTSPTSCARLEEGPHVGRAEPEPAAREDHGAAHQGAGSRRRTPSSTRSSSQEAGVTREEMAEQIEKRVRSSGMQAEITRLTEEIAALGPVNLAALSELDTARERKDFLDAQNAGPHPGRRDARGGDQAHRPRDARPAAGHVRGRERELPGDVPGALRRRPGEPEAHRRGDPRRGPAGVRAAARARRTRRSSCSRAARRRSPRSRSCSRSSS